jgi:hypothetical protein
LAPSPAATIHGADDPGTDQQVQLACTCRFRYEARAGAAAASELRMLDADERPLRLGRQIDVAQSVSSTTATIANGSSPELEVSDAAPWLELRAGNRVVERVPVRLERGEANIVR